MKYLVVGQEYRHVIYENCICGIYSVYEIHTSLYIAKSDYNKNKRAVYKTNSRVISNIIQIYKCRMWKQHTS